MSSKCPRFYHFKPKFWYFKINFYFLLPRFFGISKQILLQRISVTISQKKISEIILKNCYLGMERRLSFFLISLNLRFVF